MKSGVIVAFEVIGEALANCQFVQLLSAVWNAVKTIGSGIVKILGELGSSLAKNLGEANFSGIIDLLNGISFGAIACRYHKVLSAPSEKLLKISAVSRNLLSEFLTVFEDALKLTRLSYRLVHC